MLPTLQFLTQTPEYSLLYIGTYNPVLVGVSILIAVFASYAALDVAGQFNQASSRAAKALWLAVGSLAMGGGIWAMHFIGMLSFNLPCGVRYDPLLTLLSMVPGILASGVALHLISHPSITQRQLIGGGILLGAGIGTMHYSGMAAMRMDALLRYEPALFGLSIAVAVVLAVLALWIKFRLQALGKRYQWLVRTGSSVVMGAAISGMHYIAMGAAYFLRPGETTDASGAFDPTFLAIAVTVVTGLLIALALVATIAHRHIELSRKMATLIGELNHSQRELQKLNSTLEQRVAEEVKRSRSKDQMLIQQSRLAAMGEMVHNIAHQWRQPLNALAILLGNLKDAYHHQELDEKTLDTLMEDSRRLIKKMSTTIDDFRDFFRADKETVTFDLCRIYQDTIRILSASLNHHQVQISGDLGEQVLVSGYPNEFAQVLLNLLSNAKDAILENQIFPGCIAVTIRAENGMGVIRIRDNGGGIPEAVLPKIFDPYFTTKDKGSGIGLYMSEMIIKGNMGGAIEACNVEGGAEFSVFCPLAASP
ncbi:MAG: hypothetical protein KGZ83_13950 [Sulfuricella sp.]|nr:hypothetical protein [Sulfuricella sp.]